MNRQRVIPEVVHESLDRPKDVFHSVVQFTLKRPTVDMEPNKPPGKLEPVIIEISADNMILIQRQCLVTGYKN